MKWIFLCLGLALVTICSASAAVVYVRADASGQGLDGLSWATAFNSLPEALRRATADDELWVAAWTYRGPIQVPTGVALYGGFNGTETARTQRDWSRNKSVIDWSEWGIADAEFYNERFGPAVSLGNGSRLDGFTIANGWHSHGAGIYVGEPSAIIANNVVISNRATGLLSSSVMVDRSGQLNVGDDFFLKTANDLLRLQFPFGITNIPVAQYTPAVHRLLQVAANVHDAAHSNTFPSVFRPQFTSTPEGPIISGYYEDNSYGTLIPWLSTNQHVIPMIIGAREGFPNFNEFVLETVVSTARRLEMRRQTTNSSPHQTNEMYIIGIENRLALEAWNSYTNAYSNRLDVAIGNNLTLSITNTDGLLLRTNYLVSVGTNYDRWTGFANPSFAFHPSNTFSFKVPLFTNNVTVSNGIYRFGPPDVIEPFGNTNGYVANFGFHIPEWTLSVSNQLMFVIHSDGRIVDFVYLQSTNSLGLTTNFFSAGPGALAASEGPVGICWRTNRNGTSLYTPTEGVQQQIDISLGQVGGIEPRHWAEFANVTDPQIAISNFMSFVYPQYPMSSKNTNLIQQVPFTPARKIVISAKWEANDPLLHALPEHLKDLTNNFSVTRVTPFSNLPSTNNSLFSVNWRYRPWGGRPGQAPTADAYDRRIKDAGLGNPNAFDFPNGSKVNVDWVDRIHRGTPWQTLYFDCDVAPMNVWMRQSLDPSMHPTNDWAIIEYLRGQLSYPGAPTPTRIANNTIVGNEGGLWITANASASVMNNAVVDNTSGVFDEGTGGEFSRNCVFGNLTDNNSGDVNGPPQFVNPAVGDFSLLATSPLIDAGNDVALGWIERPVLGAEVDIGALEFGPDGVPVFRFQRTSGSEYELALHGFPGESYIVETSTNLVNWTAITTNVATMGTAILQDAASNDHSHRFYRAKVANHPN